jgi:hypothetical protein
MFREMHTTNLHKADYWNYSTGSAINNFYVKRHFPLEEESETFIRTLCSSPADNSDRAV